MDENWPQTLAQKDNTEKTDRNERVVELWNDAYKNMAEIGLELGVSRERVRQLLAIKKRQGVKVLTFYQWRRKRSRRISPNENQLKIRAELRKNARNT